MLTAVQCLVLTARQHGVDLNPERLAHDYALGDDEPSDALLARIAQENGIEAKPTRLNWEKLSNLGRAYPVILRLTNGRSVVVAGAGKHQDGREIVHVLDPLAERAELLQIERARLEARWEGMAFLLKAAPDGAHEEREFGLRWFFPEISKQKTLFIEIGIIAVIMHAIAFAVPIYMQIVLDKVLSNQAFATLYVVTTGVAVALLFNAVLGFVRQLLLLYASSKMDIRISTRIYSKLLSLPMAFFHRHAAGAIHKHVDQAGAIRQFLTGRIFLTLLDVTTLVIFIPVLMFYSPAMTGIVIGFAAMIGVVMFLTAGTHKRRLQRLFNAEAHRQSMLVESIGGIETVKALALEPLMRRRWDQVAADTVQTNFDVARLSAVSGQISTLLQTAMTVCLIFVGVHLIIAGDLTAGGLIAFNMLAARVSGPLVQMVSLVQDFQQSRISVDMLATIMNQRSEQTIRGASLKLKGGIDLDRVNFSYPNGTVAVKDASLKIPPGQIVGLVGPSGSGKSTFVKMLQGLHIPQSGSIRFDGKNMRQLDLSYLRTQIGVVPQTSFLFKGTVRENISITKPDASLEEVLIAAELAGAYEFIEKQPEGFDTELEEGAVNLSGGQRQRLAIARALLNQPKVLILDEATSALDPESEAIVQRNLERIAEGRTVLVVTHRLSQVVNADRVLVFNEGQIVGDATHDVLLKNNEPYANLWHQQHRYLSAEDATSPKRVAAQ